MSHLMSLCILIYKVGRVGLSDLSISFQHQNYMVLPFFNGSKIRVQVALPFLWCRYHVKVSLPSRGLSFLISLQRSFKQLNEK